MPENNAITDWDDAYANRDHVPGAEKFIDKWSILAQQYRDQASDDGIDVTLDIPYGKNEREKFDLFVPSLTNGMPTRGLMVFVHGGYWLAFDKSYWSHLAHGALSNNWAVAIPSYSLCPEVSISEITSQIGNAISAASSMISGEIILIGHSAGGHLISRMACENTPLPTAITDRIKRFITVSGVHDLRPLLNLKLNETLRLDLGKAELESPALLRPRPGIVIDCVAGSAERPEFIRQNNLLANIWIGLGAATRSISVEDRHHFDIIEELATLDQGWLRPVLV